jgi:GntR family transcriptional regulator/MocR family aminotransferase
VTNSWATSGVDLHLERSGSRVRVGLEEALRDAVRSERLGPGTRLPSSRTLAVDLGIARNTVADAYGQLVAEGWLVTRRGSGTWVANRAPVAQAPASPPPGGAEALRHDLRAGSPDLAGFPRSAWLAAARRALSAAPYEALDYGDPRGRPELRRAVAEYLARARGVHAHPDRVVITSGFTQGLALVCDTLLARGAQTLAVEGYSLPAHRDVAGASGLRLHPVPVDSHGAVVADLGAADAAVLTPSHQFPLGVPLAAERRMRAVEWAASGERLVIEDDYDGEFRYDRQPVGALQALAPENVVYAGTTSKTLAPGLRLGWLVLPAHLVGGVVAVKGRADRHSSALDQLTLAEFIAGGAYDRHVRRARLAYRRRRDRLIAALERQAPAVEVTGMAAGLHALVRLPPGHTERETIALAARRGLAIEGLAAYRAAAFRHDPALIIGYTRPPDHAYTAALARLSAVLGAGPRT